MFYCGPYKVHQNFQNLVLSTNLMAWTLFAWTIYIIAGSITGQNKVCICCGCLQERPKPREAQPAQSALPTALQAQPTSFQGLAAEEKQPTTA
jgi:hypothetical protein